MVVDRGVQVGVAEPGTAPRVSAVTCGGGAVEFAACAALGAPAAAVGDVAEFLDVDVDQVARAGVFVAADRLAGGPVEMGQAGDAGAAQDGVAGRGGQVQTAADSCRSPSAAGAQVQDLAFDVEVGAVRAVMWLGWIGRSCP
nr:hypothetical protein GCM10020092_017060 [Actinoplanes digitatis]